MLYPKSKEKELSPELFKSPTSEYRGTPFWAWNCKLDRDELLRQIDILREMGFGGFHMHVRSGMDTVYLGDEFIELVGDCIDHAKKNEMLAWLYDEDRWPSGFAGGYVTKDKQYRMRYLLMTKTPYAEDFASAKLHVNEQNIATRGGTDQKLLARYSVKLDESGCLASYRLLDELEEADDSVWFAYIESPALNPRYNGYTYVNTLDKKSIDRFIETTHEVYNKHFSSDFGGAVPAIFTDEPQTTFKKALRFATGTEDVTLPFTDDLEDTYKAAYGISLLEHLPEILWELPNGQISRARYCYHDHIAERFTSAFADNIGSWCREHGIMLTGHMMREPSLDSQTQAVGEAMRSYRGFDLPGIDMLSTRHEYTTAKQAQSAVNQMGCEGMLDELYGVTTWDCDFRDYKLYGDWQAAMGVTVRVPHLSWVSMEGEAKRDYPASINYQSPWWREFSLVEDHFARVNTALTRGKPVVRVGVIHPIESYWLHCGPAEQTALTRDTLDQNFSNITEWLSFGSVDFDFICESTLPLYCKEGSNPLTVGEMKYDVIIVPACETLRSTTLSRLEAFKADGGKLIFMGDCPKYVDAIASELPSGLFERSDRVSFSRGAILAALKNYRTVELRRSSGDLTGDLLYRMRQDGDDIWLFIARGRDPRNKDISSKQGVFAKLPGFYSVTLYDTITGEIQPIPYRHENGQTVIPAELYMHDSLLLKLTPSAELSLEIKPSTKPTQKALDIPYKVRFTLDEPNALMLDMAKWAVDDEPLRPAEEILRIDTTVRKSFGWTPWGGAADQPWYLPKVEPSCALHLRYEFESEVTVQNAYLAIENPEKTDITVNGDKLKIEVDGYYVDKSIKKVKLPVLIKGMNTIELTLPYGERTAAERIYVLGDFGVRVEGSRAVITKLPERLSFGSIVHQGLPFYSGKLSYHFELETSGGELDITVPQYRATLLRVKIGGYSKPVAYSPYTASFDMTTGRHEVTVEAYIPRTNGFGPLHCADDKNSYQSPGTWRTSGDAWSYEYRLCPEGVLVAPRAVEIKK